ncbi:MAG TPA: condensation domain-containing protein, partial [Pyrinomonadaceae bacterium]|nr:condensation domain-containing protein [Pyrinomonadaceae bacterium]
VGVEDNFFELGGDSILSIQVIARAVRGGVQLTPLQLFERQTIAELALVAGSGTIVQAEQDIVTGEVPLTPIQRWFFELNLLDPHHFNQAVLFDVSRLVKPNLLKQALQQLMLHHDALRLRFHRNRGTWRQTHASPGEEISFSRIDLSSLPESQHKTTIESMAQELQASLDLSAGPLMRVVVFEFNSAKPNRMLMIIHHLIVDGVSWRILLQDLTTAYQQLSHGERVTLPSKTNSFRQWADRLSQHAGSVELKRELDHWIKLADVKIDPLPVDFVTDARNDVASSRHACVSLNSEETQALLRDVPGTYHTQINDVLLTALLGAFARWTGKSSMLFDLEAHGREPIFPDMDLSRTVGWFTTMFPVLLNVNDVTDPGERLKTIKEQLRSIPNHGIGFGVLRYLCHEEETQRTMRTLPCPQVSFNYLGQFGRVNSDSTVQETRESSGEVSSPRNDRDHLLEINGSITDNRLQFTWTYNKIHYQSSTIESLAESFLAEIRILIAHCQSAEAKGYTPSDFAKARVTQQDLDKLLGKVKRGTTKNVPHNDGRH